MQLLKSKLFNRVFIALSIILYLISMLIVKIDTNFDYSWIAFWLHISSILLIFSAYLNKVFKKSDFKKILRTSELIPFSIILALSEITNFLLLSKYPYVSISDELRDGGLFAADIVSGTLKNIFAYGSYDGHGLIIPIFSGFFYHIFGGSVLTFRFPAALLSSLDVVLLYLLIRLVINKQTAFWSALILLAFPIHIFFAHTQIVVAFNFFWVPVLLLLLYRLLKKHSFTDYIFMGTVLGFALGFHAAIRGFSGLILMAILFINFKDIIFRKLTEEKIKTRISKIALLLFFVFVGFGPRLLFTEPDNFLLGNSSAFKDKAESNAPFKINDLITLKKNYVESLMVYVYEPTSFFYPVNKPIFPPLMAIFFIIGLLYSVFILRNKFLNILLFILVALPFTNSTLTDWINADHRLSPILAIAAVFAAIGISFSLKLIKNKYLKYLLGTGIALFLAWQVIVFYKDQPANKNYELKDYLLMQTYYFLQKDGKYSDTSLVSQSQKKQICIFVSSSNYKYMNNNIGIEEQEGFFLPSTDLEFKEENLASDNEVYIIKKSCSENAGLSATKNTLKIPCGEKNKYICPLNYNGEIIIRY